MLVLLLKLTIETPMMTGPNPVVPAVAHVRVIGQTDARVAVKKDNSAEHGSESAWPSSASVLHLPVLLAGAQILVSGHPGQWAA